MGDLGLSVAARSSETWCELFGAPHVSAVSSALLFAALLSQDMSEFFLFLMSWPWLKPHVSGIEDFLWS